MLHDALALHFPCALVGNPFLQDVIGDGLGLAQDRPDRTLSDHGRGTTNLSFAFAVDKCGQI